MTNLDVEANHAPDANAADFHHRGERLQTTQYFPPSTRRDHEQQHHIRRQEPTPAGLGQLKRYIMSVGVGKCVCVSTSVCVDAGGGGE